MKPARAITSGRGPGNGIARAGGWQSVALCCLLGIASLLVGLDIHRDAHAKAASGDKSGTTEPVTRVFDLHCDTVYQGVDKGWGLEKNKGAVDLGKMKKGAYVGQVFALWTPPAAGWSYLQKLHSKFDSWMKEHDARIGLATDAGQVAALDEQGRIAAVLGVEGLTPLAGDVSKIHVLHSWGVRILGLTWWHGNEFAGSSTDPDEADRGGLTEKGEQTVMLAHELGMVIDVSHASDEVVRDVAALTPDPFIASHSCSKALNAHDRNLSDEMLILIASRGGIVGVNFHTGFLTDEPKSSVSRSVVVDHVMHMVEVMGADHVALGSDFDGAHPPVGLKTAAHMQLLARDLLDKGLTQQDVDKIMYMNVLRVLSIVTGREPQPPAAAILSLPLVNRS